MFVNITAFSSLLLVHLQTQPHYCKMNAIRGDKKEGEKKKREKEKESICHVSCCAITVQDEKEAHHLPSLGRQ